MGYMITNVKQKRRKTKVRMDALSIQKEIEDILRIKGEQTGQIFVLDSVGDKYFLYQVDGQMFHVPFSFLPSGGILLSFAEQREVTDKYLNKNIRNDLSANQVVVNAFQRLIGGITMKEEEILYPAGIQTDSEKTEREKLQALQTQADKTGILLPTQYNVSLKEEKQQTRGAGEILTPCGC